MSPAVMRFTPADASVRADRARLGARLAAIGLIEPPRPDCDPARHAPGPRFAQLLCFLGCSPTVPAGEIELTGDGLIIRGVAEGTALPSDELLAALAAETGTPWRCDLEQALE